jgi:hypothetical protein
LKESLDQEESKKRREEARDKIERLKRRSEDM